MTPSEGPGEVPSDDASRVTTATRARHRRAGVPALVAAQVIAIVAVAAAHFRPWQGGLLEEWGFALAWRDEGWPGYVARLGLTAGRPVHLLPHYLGLAASGGSLTGEYVVLALVAVLQLLVAGWALRPLVSDGWLRWALALALALHPWWPAGGILRFLPAQVGVLALVAWFGLVVRYLKGGRARLVVMGAVSLLVGLLTYQALALAAAVVAMALVLVVETGRRRGVVVIGVTWAVVVVDLVYTIVVAPLLAPGSYESSIAIGGLDLGDSARRIVTTVVSSPPIWGSLLAAAFLVGLMALTVRPRRPLVLAPVLVLVAAPATSLIYAANSAHLNDPERLGLPIGVTAWVAVALMAVPLTARRGRMVGWVVVATAVIGSALVAVAWYTTWTGYSEKQQALLAAVGPIRTGLPADETLVIVDRTGTYGDVYTFLPPHLSMALDAEGYGPGAVLCTPAGVVRHHPVAARYPISTTPDCDEVAGFDNATWLADVTVPAGTLSVMVLP